MENGGKFAQSAIAFGKRSGYSDARERCFSLWDGVAQKEPLSAGGTHSLGLKADGTVVATGDNEDGQCDVSGWTGLRLPD